MIARTWKFSVLGLILLGSLVVAAPKVTEEITGKVIAVTDGDTIKLLVDKQTLTVRLEGIDAPEANQDFGNKAKQALAALVSGKTITVKKTGMDKYGRTLGFLVLEGTEINEKLVEDGWAWHFKKYNSEERFSKKEVSAREAKRGLWANPNALEPWEYRARLKLRPEVLREEESPAPALKGSGVPSKPNVPAYVSPVVEAGERSHWLNTSSGLRHNQSCQHFGKTKGGRPCSSNDGRACKICGG